MDRETWWAIVHRVAKSWTRLKQLLCTHALQMKVVVRVSCSGVGIFLYFIIIFFLSRGRSFYFNFMGSFPHFYGALIAFVKSS